MADATDPGVSRHWDRRRRHDGAEPAAARDCREPRNQDTTGSTAGADPYRRKTVTFANTMDSALGVDTVQVQNIGVDRSDFPLRYDPSHPAANAAGYVREPNVNSFIEVMTCGSPSAPTAPIFR